MSCFFFKHRGGSPWGRKVCLTNEEREQLWQIISRGKTKTGKPTHAHILPKADESPQAGPTWQDEQIAEPFGIDVTTVERIRKTFVNDDFDRALNHKKPSRSRPRKFDDDTKYASSRLSVCCLSPPGSQRFAWLPRVSLHPRTRRLVEHGRGGIQRPHAPKS